MKFLLTFGTLCFLISCSKQPAQVAQNTNAANAPLRSEKLQDTAVHTTENQPQRSSNSNSNGGSKWTASGDPIDTSKFDKAIADAEKAAKGKPSDEVLKKAAAQAYFDRGFALTEARQYASAIGDYRRALQYDPTNEDAKNWIDQIISIYQMLKKEAPKPGEEPTPLPFQKPAR